MRGAGGESDKKKTEKARGQGTEEVHNERENRRKGRMRNHEVSIREWWSAEKFIDLPG